MQVGGNLSVMVRMNVYVYIDVCDQVSPTIPSGFVVQELCGNVLEEVGPSWCYSGSSSVANICREDDLFKSNRSRLYDSVCAGAMKHILPPAKLLEPFEGTPSRVPFNTVVMPADGLCGWRGILASSDISAHVAIPRTLGGT